MTAFVVDTNVPVVANGRSPQAEPSCVLACIDALEDLIQHKKIVLDNLGRILEEYRKNLAARGQPGPGDAFFKWVWLNQSNIDHCITVEIHPCGCGSEEDYEEFPDIAELVNFDRSDRKFVAVALAGGKSTILNAVDSDWWCHRNQLRKQGVIVKFLCPDHKF